MNLHKTQEKLLDLLSDNIDSPLSMRQLREELDLSSPSLVHHHICQLEKKGFLKRNPNNPADYQILTTAEDPITFLHLYGSAKCGPEGTLLSGNPISRIPLSSRLTAFSIQQPFLVQAEGDSMPPEIKNEYFLVSKNKQTQANVDLVI